MHLEWNTRELPRTPLWEVVLASRDALLASLFAAWGTTSVAAFPGPMCVSIERRNFETVRRTRYVVCEKTDGLRYLLFCTRLDNKNVCVLVNRKLRVFLLGIHVPTAWFATTLLDGELALHRPTGRWHYLAFDAVAVNGTGVGELPLVERMRAVCAACACYAPHPQDAVVVLVKRFFDKENIRDFHEHYNCMSDDYGTDGLVLTPVDLPVASGRHQSMFKWKPVNDITIDFQVAGKHLCIYEPRARRLVRIQAAPPGLAEGTVVECTRVSGTWVPSKVRRDKRFPNDMQTYQRTMGNFAENVTLGEIVDLFS